MLFIVIITDKYISFSTSLFPLALKSPIFFFGGGVGGKLRYLFIYVILTPPECGHSDLYTFGTCSREVPLLQY